MKISRPRITIYSVAKIKEFDYAFSIFIQRWMDIRCNFDISMSKIGYAIYISYLYWLYGLVNPTIIKYFYVFVHTI